MARTLKRRRDGGRKKTTGLLRKRKTGGGKKKLLKAAEAVAGVTTRTMGMGRTRRNWTRNRSRPRRARNLRRLDQVAVRQKRDEFEKRKGTARGGW